MSDESESILPQPGEDDHCPKSPDGCHAADPGTLESADGYDHVAEGGIVFTVACSFCGKRCGSGKLPFEDIMW